MPVRLIVESHQACMWGLSRMCAYIFQGKPIHDTVKSNFYRKAVSNYMEHMMKLKERLSQLLSAALGLNTDYLSSIECMSSVNLACHYYPPCPEPELTMGATHHSDPFFLTVLLQDTIGGLQVLHQNYWVDVQPVRGALIVNIGDLMQVIIHYIFPLQSSSLLPNQRQ